MEKRILIDSRFIPYLIQEDDFDLTYKEVAEIDTYMDKFDKAGEIFYVYVLESGFNGVCDISGKKVNEYTICGIKSEKL